jgi:type III secretion protein U
MAGDDTEEKKFQPTQSRIQQLRRDGQVAHSSDFPPAVALLVLVIYLVLGYDWLSGQFQSMLVIDFNTVGIGFADSAYAMARAVIILMLIVTVPFMIMAVFVTVLVTAIDLGGFPVSAKSITPDFSRLNPVEGIKKLFKLRAVLDMVKGLLKILIIAAALSSIILLTLNSVMWAPTCDTVCVHGITKFTLGTTLIVGALLMFIFGIIDVPVSQFLFKHENRMTISEYKRNRKEDQGDPFIKGARKQRGRELLDGSPTGENYANIVIYGPGVAVGLRFEQGKTPAPIVVAKKTNEEARAFIQMARGKQLPVIDNDELAQLLVLRAASGEGIPQALFTPVAKVLVDAGVLS